MIARLPDWVLLNIILSGDAFSYEATYCILFKGSCHITLKIWLEKVMIIVTKQMSENELAYLIKQLNLDHLEDALSDQHVITGKDKKESKSEQDGWIEVKEQSIIVQDPNDGGAFPIISALAPVKLKVNDIEVVTECTVSSSDRIIWEIDVRPLFEINISEDKLSAHFHLKAKERYAWRLVDIEPISNIVITAEEDKNIVLETVQLGDVVTKLEQMSVKSNLDIASIQQELENPTYQTIIIAKGKAPTPGIDAKLEIYFSAHVESQFFDVSGSVDFRNHLHIPSVKKGEVIAKKFPKAEGMHGYDVYGNIIMPAPPKDVIIVVKPNIELTPDGEIIALKEGRPRITGGKIKTFDISTSFVVSGDVDIETGNIVFSGDVIVYGNVTDNMIIESLGNVYVYGSVYNATITATGSIFVKENVMGSKLYSGYFGVMFNRLYHTSKVLSEKVEKLLIAAKMLEQALESKKQVVRFGQIVVLLIENKFKDMIPTVKDLLSVISNIQHFKKEDYQKLKEVCEIFFHPARLLESASSSVMQSMLAMLQNTHQDVARMQEDKVHISIMQCHNSELKSNGDILVYRDGVILSDLYSAGNIIFKHELAVCRGSQLDAGDWISAKIIGGQTGANTILKAKRRVSVTKMFSGRVCIGRHCTDIYELIENKTFDVRNMRQRS